MIYIYSGNYIFERQSIILSAPDNIGVYYCGSLNWQGELMPKYIGRAMGDKVSIRNRLLDHFRENNWLGVTHFGYRICSSKEEAMNLEIAEIREYQPFYNDQWKSPIWKLLS
jgi:excinuclease UvrABC nuclease subunit